MVALLLNLNFVQVVKGDAYRNNAAQPPGAADRVLDPARPDRRAGHPGRRVGDDPGRAEVPAHLPAWPSVRRRHRLLLARSTTRTDWRRPRTRCCPATTPACSGAASPTSSPAANRKGGSVVLTLNKAAQQAAYQALGNRRGAVVALDPTTGAILAAVSTPSYDPNMLSSHNTGRDPGCPDRRARSTTRPAAAEPGVQPELSARLDLQGHRVGRRAQGRQEADRPRPGAERTGTLPGPSTGDDAQNFDGEQCGDGQTDTLDPRARRSRATPPSPSSAWTSARDAVEARPSCSAWTTSRAASRCRWRAPPSARSTGPTAALAQTSHRPAQRPDDAAAGRDDLGRGRQRRDADEALPGGHRNARPTCRS